MARGPGKAHSSAPFYVAIRRAERRILREALREFGDVRGAATALGITHVYFEQRSIHLGGVFEGQPEREPPGALADARANARAEGIKLGEATWPLRRFGKPLKRRRARSNVDGNGHDPIRRIPGDPEREAASGGAGGRPEEAGDRGEDLSE